MSENTMTLEQVRDDLRREAKAQRAHHIGSGDWFDRRADAIDAYFSRPVSVSSEDRKMFEKYAARMSLDIRHWGRRLHDLSNTEGVGSLVRRPRSRPRGGQWQWLT